ncbi:hypothetical protein PANG_00052 [Paenibacillus phage PG1]|uniref:hypothetical protein n=1 Tax=Paenibacillus phage PG1 TaxID=754053 RepID=UPI0003428F3C|nr:hypothetical protein PANG_00052 [Paenibacillus phage PG1]AGN33771.1 hypothetical protein PANG_00052 [Paenibacillus phage PG1]
MKESILGIQCPFCGERLKMETYRMKPRFAPSMTVFCDNDKCEVKPSTIDTNPSAAFADVEAWG